MRKFLRTSTVNFCFVFAFATWAGAQSPEVNRLQASDAAKWSEKSALPESTYRDFSTRPASTVKKTSVLGQDSSNEFNVQAVDSLLFGKSSANVKSSVVGTLRNEAGKGNADANVRLGAAYELGLGVQKDNDAAFAYYYEAAQNNNAGAQRILGRAFMTGVGTAPNYTESFKWLKSAYELGDRGSSLDLAKSYQFGLGVKPDADQSEAFWKQAAEGNSSEAYLGYAEFLAAEKQVPLTDPSIRMLVEKAADLSDPKAVRAAYQISIQSRDVDHQDKWKVKLLDFSKEGDILSTLELGDAYAKGDAADDRASALKFYKAAADVGNAYGLAKYGSMILQHPNLEPGVSTSEARALVKGAAESGEPTALITLASLAKSDGDPRKAYDYAIAAAELGGAAYSERAREIRLSVCAEKVDATCQPIPVFYITNRNVVPDGSPTQYQNRLGTKLSMGHSLVSIPTNDTVSVDQKSYWKMFLDYLSTVHTSPPSHQTTTTPIDNDIVNTTFDGDVTQFLNTVKQVGRNNERKKVVVFIHGFANTFDDAVRRLGLISEGSKFPGIPLVLSWASAAEEGVTLSSIDGYSGVGYLNDTRTVGQSCADFQRVLEQVIDVFGSENVIVLAHSMGGQLVDYILTGCPSYPVAWLSTRKIDNLILAAPDVDLAEFSKAEHVDRVKAAVNNFTLYVSANDLALRLSQDAGGERRRLGQGGPERFIAENIMTIDATTVEKNDDLNHSYVFDIPQVKRDLSDVFHGNIDPDDRDCPKPETDAASKLNYWIIQPGCTN